MGRARRYQDLLDENLRLRTENGDLKEENRRLKAEVARLRGEMNAEVRTDKERPFGNDTPSSKVNFKPSADGKRVRRNGGGVSGHDGRGRGTVTADEADEDVALPRPERCGVCGGGLVDFGREGRTVRVAVPAHYRTPHYTVMKGGARRAGAWRRPGSPAYSRSSRLRTRFSRRTSWTASSTA